MTREGDASSLRPAPGLVIAAPASGSGKTTVTLGLLRALRDRGVSVASAKVGPDYIDPRFHEAASGKPCPNLDSWAMRRSTVDDLVAGLSLTAELVVCEGVMGLFDGAPVREDGVRGTTAEIAALTGWPVVLVVDAGGQGQSIAALACGFRDHRPGVRLAGVIANRVGGPGHVALLRDALADAGVPLLGALPRRAGLALPSRHLGLVQAEETTNLEDFIAAAAAETAEHVDIDAVRAAAFPAAQRQRHGTVPLPPPGQRIALAQDAAFAFVYPHVLDGWRRAGAEIRPFSPLVDEAPDETADAVVLPGGYPELHADRLAKGERWRRGVLSAADRGAVVYGECGGYMVLGRGLTDADGTRHPMCGLLPLESSFADRRLHLGYRAVALADSGPLGAAGTFLRGHEFHYATVLDEGDGDPLFLARDAAGRDLGNVGRRIGVVAGSFVHVVDRTE